MSYQATAWAQRCHVGNGTAKAVLMFLADKAQPDGTGARPKIDTICAVVEFKRRAVINALRLLESRGFIRRGDQRLARLLPNGRVRPEQYAQVVWDLAVDEDPEVLSYVDRVGERDTDPVDDRTDLAADAAAPAGTDDKGGETDGSGDVPDPAESRGALNARLENEGQGCTRCTSRGALNARPEVHEMHPSYKEQPSEEPSGLTNNPSAPSGHLPAGGGATAQDDGGNGDGCPDGRDRAGRVLDAMADLRGSRGLSTPDPSPADLRAVSRLLDRLANGPGADPAERVLAALRWAMSGDWWPKRIRTGRQLEARWDELADDLTVAAAHGDPQATPAADAPAAGHTHGPSCEHVAAVVESMRGVEPDMVHRHACDEQVAEWLNEGRTAPQAAGLLRGLLEERRRRREDDARRLAEARRANGGSMFTGSRRPNGGGEA